MDKKHKVIVLSLDYTLTSPQVALDRMALFFDKKALGVWEMKHPSIADNYDLSKERESIFWNEEKDVVRIRTLLETDRIKNILATYTDKDTFIYVLTKRPLDEGMDTVDWLLAKNFPFDDLFSVENDEEALEVLKSVDADAVFHDEPSFFEALRNREDLQHIFSYCIDYPYNADSFSNVRLNRDTGDIIPVLQFEGGPSF